MSIHNFKTAALALALLGACVCACAQSTSPAGGPPGIAAIIPGETGTLDAIALAPNGSFFVTGSTSGATNVRSVANGAVLLTVSQQTGITGVAVSRDSTALFTASAFSDDPAGQITKYSVLDGSILMIGPQLPVPSSIAVSADGSLLAVGAGDNKVYLLDTTFLSVVSILSGHAAPVTSLAFAATSATSLASGDQNGAVILWNTSTGIGVPLNNAQTSAISGLAISPASADTIVSGAGDGTVKIVSASKNAVVTSLSISGQAITALAVSLDGKVLAAIDDSSTVETWSIATGKKLISFSDPAIAVQDVMQFAPGDTAMLIGGGTFLSKFRVSDGHPLGQLNSVGALPAAILQAPTNTEFAIAQDGGGVLRFTTNGATQLASVPGGAPLAYSPDATLLAAGSPPTVYNLVTNGIKRSFSTGVFNMALPAGDASIVTYDGSNLIDYNLVDGSVLASAAVAQSTLPSAITPDSKYFANWANGAINVYKVAGGAVVATISLAATTTNAGTTPPGPVALSSNGAVVAYSNGPNLLVFKVSSGALLASLGPPAGTNYLANQWALSPLGDQIASMVQEPGNYAGLYMYRISDKAATFYDKQLGMGMSSMAYSNDGTMLYLGRLDGCVVLAYSPYPTSLSGLSVSASLLQGGINNATGVVNITAAVAQPLTVTLRSGNPAVLAVPATLQVKAASTTASFAITSSSVAQTTLVAVYATYNGLTRTAWITVEPPVKVSSVTASPTSVVGGYGATGIVHLAEAAPSAGLNVALASSGSIATVPTVVFVPAGKKNAVFGILTAPVTVAGTVQITASHGGVSASAALTVNPVVPVSLTLLPATITGGDDSIGILMLSAPAPADTVVVLSSSASGVAAPDILKLTVPAGRQLSAFYLSSVTIGVGKIVAISAAANGATVTANLSVMP